MPKKFKPIGTEAQKATWAAMKYAHDEYQKLPTFEREAYKVLTAKSQMCNRDFVTKLCLKNYPDLGKKYSSWRVAFEPLGAGETKVLVSKAFLADDIVSCMTYAERVKLLYFREINPNLRGKKFRRRWDLVENIEKAHRVEGFEPVGIEIEFLENNTGPIRPANSVFAGNYVFQTEYTDGFSVYEIVAGSLSFVTSADPGASLTNIAERDSFLFAVSHLGGMFGYFFDGSSLDPRGSVSLGFNFNDIVVDDDYIYTAEQVDGVAVYTHNGTSFSLVTRVNTGGNCLSVYVFGSYVVVANLNGEILLYSFNGISLTLLDTFIPAFNPIRMRGFQDYIAVSTYTPSVEVLKIVGGKLEAVTNIAVGFLINNIRFLGSFIFCSNHANPPSILKFYNDVLYPVFEGTPGVQSTGLGVDESRYLASTIYNGVFLYEYSDISGFGYDFIANQANGDEFLCIKSDPADSSSYGLSGVYAIPY